MASWPTVIDLEVQLGSTLTGDKAMIGQDALNAASEWVAERCDLFQRDIYDIYVLLDGARVLVASIPAPVRQAIILYAAKFYRRKDTPDGVAGTAENGLMRTGRFDSDAEALLAPYTLYTIG